MKSILDKMRSDAENKGGGNAYLKMADKEQLRIRFLQELDEQAPGYDKDKGLALYVRLHQNPENFKKQAVCTYEDEGDCWACNQIDSNPKWRAKGRLFVNVLVTDKTGERTVKVLNQNASFEKHCIVQLLEYAEEYGTITDRDYKIKRTGTDMNNTSYTLTPLDKADTPDLEGLELHDLSKFVRNIAPDKQEEFFTAGEPEKSGTDGW